MGGARPEGGYLAPALNGTAHAWHHAPDVLFRIVRDGSPAADSSMKGWAGRLGDGEIEAVLAHLRALWPEPIRERYRAMFEGK
jgi:mono/diheme cytochrome c family protein